MPIATIDVARLEPRLKKLYGSRADEAAALIKQRIESASLEPVTRPSLSDSSWDESDVVLITYGDQIRSTETPPLQTFRTFLQRYDLPSLTNTIHFLPFFPFSSDDGFSVIDYRRIDPYVGDWRDVHQIGAMCNLMFDFVVNHISQQSLWFRGYLSGKSPYDNYFIEASPDDDLSQVTRPRSLPLLSDYETSRGTKWLWTTFSRDQIDLNLQTPAVLAELIEILVEYARHGARIIRLDAIAYLWKQIGTSCIHLSQTHEVVKLFRDVLETVAPETLILTETNVPHRENMSYFGDGDEAHMIYQFSLPPLILDAFLNDDAQPLKHWLANLNAPPQGTTYFNFTASHDGIGVRPLEGHVDGPRLTSLVEKIKQRGGLVSTRRETDGTDTPYELNISYVDALSPDVADDEVHVQRFLASQALSLALQGMPAIYFHSLVGTQNDYEGAKQSGVPRRINRRKFELNELSTRIESTDNLAHHIFDGMRKLLATRIQQPAFHPNANQRYIESNTDHILCFERLCRRSGQQILVAINFSTSPQTCDIPTAYDDAVELLGSSVQPTNQRLELAPAQIVWLERRS